MNVLVSFIEASFLSPVVFENCALSFNSKRSAIFFISCSVFLLFSINSQYFPLKKLSFSLFSKNSESLQMKSIFFLDASCLSKRESYKFLI